MQIPEGISSTTGLIVKIDADADGTFETTLTISTDFLVAPLNAADNTPVWPYTEILAVSNYTLPVHTSGRPGVQVTATFGWPAVPDDITQACILLSHDLFKSKDAPFGVAGVNDFGALRVTQNRTIAMLLDPYRKASARAA